MIRLIRTRKTTRTPMRRKTKSRVTTKLPAQSIKLKSKLSSRVNLLVSLRCRKRQLRK
jgi:hypothetical protein